METIRISKEPASSPSASAGNTVAGSTVVPGTRKKTSLAQRLDVVSFYLLITLSFFLPLFFLPGLSVSYAKAALTVGVTVLLLVLWIIRQLKSDRVSILSHILPLSLLGIIGVFLVSSLVSGNYRLSLFGIGFESGTGIAMIVGAVIALLMPTILRTRGRVFTFLSSFFASFFVVALYQGIRIVGGPEILTLGIFHATTDTVIGKWNELSIFFGLSTLLSVITLEALALNRLFKTVTWIALVVSTLFLAITNFSYTLIPVAIVALVGLLYLYAVRRRISVSIAIVFVVSTLFIFAGTAIHTYINNHLTSRLAISQLEVSPSFEHTADLAMITLRQNPLWGTGPGLFARQWLLHKPSDVNQSQFWDNAFAYGRGLIPTYFITTGLLGTLIILVFLASLVYVGLRAVFSPVSSSFAYYLLASTFFGSIYLWLFQFFYVPSSGLLGLTFLFTGAFLAMLSLEGLISEKKFAYRESPRASFAWVMVLIATLIGSGAVAVITWNKTASSFALSRAYTALNANDVTKGEEGVKRAIAYDPTDALYRIMVDIQTSKMGAILNAVNNQGITGPDGKKMSDQQIAAQLSPLLTDALDHAGKAVQANPTGYENWISLGSVYEGVMPLGYKGAYENAVSAYGKAMELAPLQPSLPLIMARLEASKPGRKDYVVAREWLAKSLALKQNYTDALFFDSQLSINEGNVKNAITSVAQVAFLRPSDPTVFFQLGYLKYSDKDYKGAIEALQKAVALNPEYANARYFLGLSLSKDGDNAGALAQFEEIAKLNPDNADVKAILANLRMGRPAIRESASVISSKNDAKKANPLSPSGPSAGGSSSKKLPVKGE